MGNPKLLNEVIKNSGKKKGYLAEKIGVSRQTFTKRCKEPEMLTNLQVSILCEELNITKLTDRVKIFG